MLIDRKKLKNQFDKNGFVLIPSLLSKKEVETIKDDLEKYKYKQSKILKGRDINFTSDGNINSIHYMDKWKWTKKIQNTPKIKNLAKILLNEKPVNYGAELFAKPAKTGLKVPPHQDNYYWAIDDANALTFWISLDYSNKKNGGIYYYSGSNKLGLLEHKPSYAPGSSQTIKYPESMKFFKKIFPSLKPGDCVAHNVLVVHGSEKNNSNLPRSGWTIRYKSVKSKKDIFQEKRYLSELKMQIRKRKVARI
tara:strand:+ start:1016 stop:1765 length:750 start_codon:yes stop_codon:yes gene_type:complete